MCELLHTCTETSEVKARKELVHQQTPLPTSYATQVTLSNAKQACTYRHNYILSLFMAACKAITSLRNNFIQLSTSDVHIFLHNHKLITFSGSPVATAPTLLLMSLLDTNLLYEVGVLSSTVNPRLSSSTLTGRPSLEKPFIVAKSNSNVETNGRE